MKKVELGERIEATRYLGREFLVWLWWMVSEERELPGGVAVSFDDRLVLERRSDVPERTAMRGLCPSSGAEATHALRDGKLPVSARLCVQRSEQFWRFTFDADRFALVGVRLPQLLTAEEDEAFHERMQLASEIESIVDRLFAEFVRVRTKEWTETAMAIRGWVRGEERAA